MNTCNCMLQNKDGECECDLCPDGETIKRKYLEPECYCTCPDGTEKEMKSDGTCPVSNIPSHRLKILFILSNVSVQLDERLHQHLLL